MAGKKAVGGLCEFCSYEGPFEEIPENPGHYRCPSCWNEPRKHTRDEWLG